MHRKSVHIPSLILIRKCPELEKKTNIYAPNTKELKSKQVTMPVSVAVWLFLFSANKIEENITEMRDKKEALNVCVVCTVQSPANNGYITLLLHISSVHFMRH